MREGLIVQTAVATATLDNLSCPLDHTLLTSPSTRQAARDIVDSFLTALPEEMPLHALLTALTSTFVTLCDAHAIEPEATFSQVADTLFRDPDAGDPSREIGHRIKSGSR